MTSGLDGSGRTTRASTGRGSDLTQDSQEKGRSILADIFEWVAIIAVAIGCSFLIRAFVAEVYEVPSGSMLETIQLGDRILGEKITYRSSTPQSGDVVTFEDPENSSTILIKRVIAVSGQTVSFKEGSVYVDGSKISEPYTLGKATEALSQHSSILSGSISYPYTVPDGYIWVMGDNRTNSLDSRYFGPVAISSVTSKAMFIFWPFSDAKSL